MPNPLESLREVGHALDQIAECKFCGGSRMVRYTAWRRHGIGKRGVSVGTPTAQEELTPERHCTCVGGVLWPRLCATQFGRDLKLSSVRADEYEKGRVVFWFPGEEGVEGGEPGWMEMPAGNWRQMLVKIWARVRAGKSAVECCQEQGEAARHE